MPGGKGSSCWGDKHHRTPSPPNRNVFPPTNWSELNPLYTITPPPPHSERVKLFISHLRCSIVWELWSLTETWHRALHVSAEEKSEKEASWRDGIMPPDSLTWNSVFTPHPALRGIPAHKNITVFFLTFLEQKLLSLVLLSLVGILKMNFTRSCGRTKRD